MGHVAEAVMGVQGVQGFLRVAQKATRATLPSWSGVVPRANFRSLPVSSRAAAQVVYFPSCISRVMGTSMVAGQPGLIDVMASVSRRAGIALWAPGDSPGNCCGMPFSSKGYTLAFRETFHRTLQRFWEWSDHGRLPVVIDSSSCAYTLLTSGSKALPEDQEKLARMTLLDPIEYAHRFLLPALSFHPLPGAVVLHPNCSAVKLGLVDKMTSVARACAQSVVVPKALRCCGFAGDRGLLFPELTLAASRPEAEEVIQGHYLGYYSSNLTCEMGMTQSTGQFYQSILYLIDKASTPVHEHSS